MIYLKIRFRDFLVDSVVNESDRAYIKLGSYCFMEYINIKKFARDVKDNVGNKKMDDVFDALFTEFEKALYEAMDMNHVEQYKTLYAYGLNKVIEEVKKFKKPEKVPAINKSIINLNEAMDDTIQDLQEDAKLIRRRDGK